MSGRSVPYGEVVVNLKFEDTSKINMEVENNSTVDDAIHACMLQLSLKAHQKIFGRRGRRL